MQAQRPLSWEEFQQKHQPVAVRPSSVPIALRPLRRPVPIQGVRPNILTQKFAPVAQPPIRAFVLPFDSTPILSRVSQNTFKPSVPLWVSNNRMPLATAAVVMVALGAGTAVYYNAAYQTPAVPQPTPEEVLALPEIKAPEVVTPVAIPVVTPAPTLSEDVQKQIELKAEKLEAQKQALIEAKRIDDQQKAERRAAARKAAQERASKEKVEQAIAAQQKANAEKIEARKQAEAQEVQASITPEFQESAKIENAPQEQEDVAAVQEQSDDKLFTPGQWQRLGRAGDPNTLSMDAVVLAEEKASQETGRPVRFYKVNEGGQWWVNLVDSTPRGIVNRMRDPQSGQMMEGLEDAMNSSHAFTENPYKFKPTEEDKGLMKYVRIAHKFLTARAPTRTNVAQAASVSALAHR